MGRIVRQAVAKADNLSKSMPVRERERPIRSNNNRQMYSSEQQRHQTAGQKHAWLERKIYTEFTVRVAVLDDQDLLDDGFEPAAFALAALHSSQYHEPKGGSSRLTHSRWNCEHQPAYQHDET